MNDREFYTYLHCRPDGTPFYVGKGFGNRAYHIERNRNPHHRHIVAKYGAMNIRVYIFECDSETQALTDEIHQIAQLRAEGHNLANITNGGDGVSGLVHSEKTRRLLAKKAAMASRAIWNDPEYRERMSRIRSEQYHPTGLRHTENAKRRIGEASKCNQYALGYHHTEEAKERIGKASVGRKPYLGRKHDDKTKQKMSEAHMGHETSAETRAKIGAAHRGKTITEEHRAIISKTHKGKPWSTARRAAYQKKIGEST
jgi:hypothetical protein